MDGNLYALIFRSGKPFEEISLSAKKNLKSLLLYALQEPQNEAINSQRHRSRKRAADPEAYRLKVRADKNAWAEKNQDKVNKIAAKSQNKSRELRRFYCGVCEIAFQSDSALKKYTLTNNHVNCLAGVTKSAPSDHVIATAAARDAAKANKTHYCSTCDKAFGDDFNLRRHNATPSNAKRVERLKS